MNQSHVIDCCGCGLCEVVCTNNCILKIRAERKSEVFVKGEGCIKCGRCDKVCPLKSNIFHKKQEKFYRAILIDKKRINDPIS